MLEAAAESAPLGASSPCVGETDLGVCLPLLPFTTPTPTLPCFPACSRIGAPSKISQPQGAAWNMA